MLLWPCGPPIIICNPKEFENKAFLMFNGLFRGLKSRFFSLFFFVCEMSKIVGNYGNELIDWTLFRSQSIWVVFQGRRNFTFFLDRQEKTGWWHKLSGSPSCFLVLLPQKKFFFVNFLLFHSKKFLVKTLRSTFCLLSLFLSHCRKAFLPRVIFANIEQKAFQEGSLSPECILVCVH